MSLSWYVNRLRSMEPAEIAHRFAEKSRKLVSKRQHQGWPRFGAKGLRPVLPHLADQVRAASPGQKQAIAQASGVLLAGHYTALGTAWPVLQDGLFSSQLWRLDPVTGTLWPGADRYCFDIDFRHDGTRGDIKYVWEINRLQFLPVLAAQYVLSGDRAGLRAIEAALQSWYEANPPFGGVGWASGIEVALRATSIILTLDLLGEALSPEARARAEQILSASGFWLNRFPSRFSSANNHLVAELVGEFLIGQALGLPHDHAWAQVLAELDKQILPDGGGAEQTPTYAAFTVELVLMAALAARHAGKTLPQHSTERLAAFHNFLAWLGPYARFGDDDEGRVLAWGDEADYPASVGAAIAAMLGQASGVNPADDFRALLFGRPLEVRPAPTGVRSLEATGLSISRERFHNRAVTLRFDHGPLGYLSIAAHGHADALAIELDIDGQQVLVDPGTYLYGSGGAWRDWFRSTAAHNTLNLERQSQSLMSGAFNWSHKARSQLLSRVDGPDWAWVGEHDGYERRFQARHRRRVQRQGSTILIDDFLIGTAQDAEIVFQLAPDLDVLRNGAQIEVRKGDTSFLVMDLPKGTVDIQSGGETPGGGGWVSRRFGSKTAAPRISWRGQVDERGVRTRLLVPAH